jgi:hypothetical protein
MVGEHNIKLGQFSPIRLVFRVELGPRVLMLWALVDLGLVRCRLVGIARWAGSRCATLTSGIRVEG